MGNLNYNAQQKADQAGFESDRTPIPAGDYPVVITESSYDVNKSNTGKVLMLKYEIIDGPMKGNTIMEFLSLEHEKQKTQEIAEKAFNSILFAIGKLNGTLRDSSEIHNLPLMIRVAYKEGEKYPNSVTKHMSISGDEPGSGSAPAASQSAASAGGAAKRPWVK